HTRSKRDWSSDVCSSDLGEPLALDAEQSIGGNDSVDDEFVDRTAAQSHGLLGRVEAQTLAGGGRVDDECADALVPGLDVALRVDDDEIGKSGIRDEAFRALDVPAAFDASGLRRHLDGIRPGPRLGQPERPDNLTCSGTWQPRLT